MSKGKQRFRRKNRIENIELLKQSGLNFKSFDAEGIHLRVINKFDFWPSTGLFLNLRTRERGHGIPALIEKAKEC